MIERIARPRQIQRAIDDLHRIALGLDGHRQALESIALDFKAAGCDTDELVDVDHDLRHAWQHATSQRRALVMAWPAEDGE